MKLHAEELTPLHRRGKSSAVLALAHRGFDHWSPIGVSEVHERILAEVRAASAKCRELATGSIPHAATSRRQEISHIRRRTSPGRAAGALPGSTQTSTACPGKCRAEELCRSMASDDRLLQSARTERSWPRNVLRPAKQSCRLSRSDSGSAVITDSCPRWSKAFFTEARLPALIVDNGDHSNPFVLGSRRAMRRSRQQAARSAREKALNRDSIL